MGKFHKQLQVTKQVTECLYFKTQNYTCYVKTYACSMYKLPWEWEREIPNSREWIRRLMRLHKDHRECMNVEY